MHPYYYPPTYGYPPYSPYGYPQPQFQSGPARGADSAPSGPPQPHQHLSSSRDPSATGYQPVAPPTYPAPYYQHPPQQTQTQPQQQQPQQQQHQPYVWPAPDGATSATTASY